MLQISLLSTKKILNSRLSELYSTDIIDEWFDLYLTPTAKQMNRTLIEFSPVRNQIFWQRRPLI
jgi:hypothetical protein